MTIRPSPVLSFFEFITIFETPCKDNLQNEKRPNAILQSSLSNLGRDHLTISILKILIYILNKKINFKINL
jgi:hypothetical protein